MDAEKRKKIIERYKATRLKNVCDEKPIENKKKGNDILVGYKCA